MSLVKILSRDFKNYFISRQSTPLGFTLIQWVFCPVSVPFAKSCSAILVYFIHLPFWDLIGFGWCLWSKLNSGSLCWVSLCLCHAVCIEVCLELGLVYMWNQRNCFSIFSLDFPLYILIYKISFTIFWLKGLVFLYAFEFFPFGAGLGMTHQSSWGGEWCWEQRWFPHILLGSFS